MLTQTNNNDHMFTLTLGVDWKYIGIFNDAVHSSENGKPILELYVFAA